MFKKERAVLWKKGWTSELIETFRRGRKVVNLLKKIDSEVRKRTFVIKV